MPGVAAARGLCGLAGPHVAGAGAVPRDKDQPRERRRRQCKCKDAGCEPARATDRQAAGACPHPHHRADVVCRIGTIEDQSLLLHQGTSHRRVTPPAQLNGTYQRFRPAGWEVGGAGGGCERRSGIAGRLWRLQCGRPPHSLPSPETEPAHGPSRGRRRPGSRKRCTVPTSCLANQAHSNRSVSDSNTLPWFCSTPCPQTSLSATLLRWGPGKRRLRTRRAPQQAVRVPSQNCAFFPTSLGRKYSTLPGAPRSTLVAAGALSGWSK